MTVIRNSQDAFMENYFESQRDQIFRNVEVLIYVFDIESSEKKKDLEYFRSCLDAIQQNSRSAHVFCLIHKMDLIAKEEDRHKVSFFWRLSDRNIRFDADYHSQVFEERKAELVALANPMKVTCFRTSIWDETLYKVSVHSDDWQTVLID